MRAIFYIKICILVSSLSICSKSSEAPGPELKQLPQETLNSELIKLSLGDENGNSKIKSDVLNGLENCEIKANIYNTVFSCNKYILVFDSAELEKKGSVEEIRIKYFFDAKTTRLNMMDDYLYFIMNSEKERRKIIMMLHLQALNRKYFEISYSIEEEPLDISAVRVENSVMYSILFRLEEALNQYYVRTFTFNPENVKYVRSSPMVSFKSDLDLRTVKAGLHLKFNPLLGLVNLFVIFGDRSISVFTISAFQPEDIRREDFEFKNFAPELKDVREIEIEGDTFILKGSEPVYHVLKFVNSREQIKYFCKIPVADPVGKKPQWPRIISAKEKDKSLDFILLHDGSRIRLVKMIDIPGTDSRCELVKEVDLGFERFDNKSIQPKHFLFISFPPEKRFSLHYSSENYSESKGNFVRSKQFLLFFEKSCCDIYLRRVAFCLSHQSFTDEFCETCAENEHSTGFQAELCHSCREENELAKNPECLASKVAERNVSCARFYETEFNVTSNSLKPVGTQFLNPDDESNEVCKLGCERANFSFYYKENVCVSDERQEVIQDYCKAFRTCADCSAGAWCVWENNSNCVNYLEKPVSERKYRLFQKFDYCPRPEICTGQHFFEEKRNQIFVKPFGGWLKVSKNDFCSWLIYPKSNRHGNMQISLKVEMSPNFFHNESKNNMMPELSICYHQHRDSYSLGSSGEDDCTLIIIPTDFRTSYSIVYPIFARWIRVGLLIKENSTVNVSNFKLSYEVLFDYFDENTQVLSFWLLGILAFIIMLLIILSIFKRIFGRYTYRFLPREIIGINLSIQDAPETNENPQVRMERLLKSGCILRDKYSANSEVVFESKQCAFCLEDFVDGAIIGTLRCSHFYHFDCLSQWNNCEKKALRCPMCIRPLESAESDFVALNTTGDVHALAISQLTNH